MKRLVATLLVLAITAGCASHRRPPTAATPPPSVTVAPPKSAEALPAVPPVSVGPRTIPPGAAQPPEAAPAPPPPPPPTAPPVPPAQRGRFVVLNFDNADIETVIQAASEIVGFNYVLAPDVRGKVTVQTSGRIAQEEVFGVLLAILEVQGFTAVKSGNLYKIVRIEGARERAVPTIVGPTADPNRTTDEIITQIVPIKYSSVADLSALLRPLISTRGTLIAHRETNVLIITDAASNVTRLLDIIRLVDVQVAQEELQIIPISYADAGELATILTQLFASGRVRFATPGAPPAPAPPQPGVPAPSAAPGQPSGSAERAPLIIPERRSNSLIVHAKKHEVETIKRLVSQLDVNIYGGRRVFIYYAENAKSKDLASTLNAIYGARDSGTATTSSSSTTPPRTGAPPPPPPPSLYGPAPGLIPGAASSPEILAEGQVRFIADEVTNAVIVTTFPRSWTEIENTIKQLDRMPRQVLIEVLVAEITLTDDIRLGIDWAVRAGRLNIVNTNTGAPGLPTTPSPPDSSTMFLPIGVGGPARVLGPFGQGLSAFTFGTDQFIAMLNALSNENKVNIVSNPHILTSENKKAVINVSTSVPIVTSQTTGQVAAATTTTTSTTTTAGLNQTVEYRDAGVILTVTPRIGEQGTVALDVKQEANQIGSPVPPTN
jgi:general secretion pathway protein D